MLFKLYDVFARYILQTNNNCRSCARRAKLTLLLIVVVTSDSANLQTRSVDYLIFRKSRTKLDDGYDVLAQSVVTTDLNIA